MKKSKKLMSVLLMGALSLSMVFTAACGKEKSSKDSLVLTVGESKVTLDEMMYYIYAVESEGNYMEAMYQQYEQSYWDAEFEEGVTMREYTKSFLIDTITMYEVLHDKAMKAGYTISDEEKAEAETNADKILTNVSEEQLKVTGFTKENLTKVQEKLILGEKYYKTMLEELNLNKDEIKATVNAADYDEYTTEYIFTPLKSYDEAGAVIDADDATKADLKDKMDKALVQVKAGETFANIATADSGLQASTLVFLNGDANTEVAYQEAAMKLKNNEYTDSVIETDYGFYIIKMVDNASTTTYDKAVTDAIAAKEQEGFNTAYEAILVDYNHTVNEEVWGPLVMGTITTVPTTTTPTTVE